MALSIIIVNYKTPGLLLDCLTEMHKDAVATGFEIIIVDNHSEDDSVALVTAAFPKVIWVQMDYNAGFSRANNAGFQRASGDTLLLLNSDTLPRGGVIEECYQRLRHSRYVACGVQLLNTDGTPQISGNFFMKGGLNYLLPLPYLGAWVKHAGNTMKVARPNVPEATDLVEVDWINGAFLMVKKEAIVQAGAMDEDFFLYAEEIEWCSRLRRLGPLCIYGQFHVIHLQGASANETFSSTGQGYYNLYDKKGLQIMLSNFVRIRKQFGVAWFLIQLFFYIVDIPVFFLGMVLSQPGKKTRYTWTQFHQFCGNVGVILRKSFIIIRNKPYFYKII